MAELMNDNNLLSIQKSEFIITMANQIKENIQFCKDEEQLIRDIQDQVTEIIMDDQFMQKMRLVERSLRDDAESKQMNQDELADKLNLTTKQISDRVILQAEDKARKLKPKKKLNKIDLKTLEEIERKEQEDK